MPALADRFETEAEIQAELGKLSAKHRAELIAHLGHPPDPKNVPAEFWDKVQREREAALVILLFGIFVTQARLHGLTEAEAELAAHDWATDHAAEVAADYTEHSRDMLADLHDDWSDQAADLVTHAAHQEWTPEETREAQTSLYADAVEDGAGKIFGETRDARMAVKETTTASVMGGEDAMAAMGLLSSQDIWRAMPGACDTCLDLDGTPREEWEIEYPNGPADSHPFCRCEIEYARDETPKPQAAVKWHRLRKYSPDQERVPAGSPDGGEFAGGGGDAASGGADPIHLQIEPDDEGKIRDEVGLSPKEIAEVVGAQPGSEVTARLDKDERGKTKVSVVVEGPGYHNEQSIYSDHIHNDLMLVNDRGHGLGVKVFADQVAAAMQHKNLRYIDLLAAGGKGWPGGKQWNGYYTWPRFGFDAKLADVTDSLRTMAYARNVLHKSDPRVSDFMKSAESRDWWKKNGNSGDMKFNLSPSSQSVRVFNAYLKARSDSPARGKSASAMQKPSYGGSAGVVEAPALTPDDERLLDEIWDRIGREESKAAAKSFRKYSEDQPRDNLGRWTDSGGSASAGEPNSGGFSAGYDWAKVNAVVSGVREEWGYKEPVNVTSASGTDFERGGVAWHEAANCDLKTGRVTIYSGSGFTDDAAVKRVAAHEMMHGMFEAVFQRYQGDLTRIAVLDDPEAVVKPSGELRPGFDKEYPTYARMQPLLMSTEKQLAKDDGVTEYSKAYWRDSEAGKVSAHIAVHETLAEMAGIYQVTGRLPGSELYQDISRNVRDEYDAIKSGKKRHYDEIKSVGGHHKSTEPENRPPKPLWSDYAIYLDADFSPVPAEDAVYVEYWTAGGAHGWGTRNELEQSP